MHAVAEKYQGYCIQVHTFTSTTSYMVGPFATRDEMEADSCLMIEAFRAGEPRGVFDHVPRDWTVVAHYLQGETYPQDCHLLGVVLNPKKGDESDRIAAEILDWNMEPDVAGGPGWHKPQREADYAAAWRGGDLGGMA